ncbi:hypothetical protein ZHAS_00012718 [Anopheles sinensis]|uniref:Uncharacterized protein n=1 Tax=Anopheles sinensis TaxID=74873 RepID=A0A084W3L5_ANOSI|nr:hypothetical protein ZHAS_00012718 [Anopheles sinensis]
MQISRSYVTSELLPGIRQLGHHGKNVSLHGYHLAPVPVYPIVDGLTGVNLSLLAYGPFASLMKLGRPGGSAGTSEDTFDVQPAVRFPAVRGVGCWGSYFRFYFMTDVGRIA